MHIPAGANEERGARAVTRLSGLSGLRGAHGSAPAGTVLRQASDGPSGYTGRARLWRAYCRASWAGLSMASTQSWLRVRTRYWTRPPRFREVIVFAGAPYG